MPFQSTQIEMRVLECVSQINRKAWDEIREANYLFTDPAYLQAVEEAHALESQSIIFEFYLEQELICGLAGYIFTMDMLNYCSKQLARLLAQLRKLLPNFLKFKTLIIGTPISIGKTIVLTPRHTSENLRIIVSNLVSYSEEKEIKLLLVRDFKDEKTPLEYALEKIGFIALSNFPQAFMPIPWKSFDEYLAAMRYRYRNETHRRMKQKNKLGIHTYLNNQASALDYSKSYVQLYENVLKQSDEFPHEFIGEAYHRAMWDNLSNRNIWLQYFQEDELIGFSHFIQYGDQIINQYLGFDYRVAKDAKLYFNALYDIIEFAIKHNVKVIEVGVTTYQAKSSVGFSIVPQRMYLWHRQWLFRKLSRYLAPNLTSNELSKCHVIFKDQTLQSLPKKL